MIQSRKFVAAVILAAIGLLAAAFVVAPFDATARAAGGATDVDVAERIGGAFASLSEVEPDPAITAAALRASKGDRAPVRSCAGGTWPDIDAACLSSADGAPVGPVRTITIGYQSDAATTVLVRIPAGEMAAR